MTPPRQCLLPPDTVVTHWRPGFNATAVAAAAGYRALRMVDGTWYLGGAARNLTRMYLEEPCAELLAPGMGARGEALCREKVLGGGGALWGEASDASTEEADVWPALALVAERLWSRRGLRGFAAALPRLHRFRCRLLERGVAAGPVLPAGGGGSGAPPGPGECEAQR
jgi:hypothetical protein